MAVELDPLAGPSGAEKGRRLAAFWQDQINSIKDSTDYKTWFKRGEAIEKRYRDDRTRTDDGKARRYNALWSNVEILKPALYGRTPLPIAERRFKDKDPTGRAASQILERALRNEIEICGYDEALQRAVGDYVLPGRGTVWVRYEPQIEDSVSLPADPQEDMSDSQGEIEDDEDQLPQDMTPGGRVRARLDEPEGEGGEPSEEETQDKLDDTGDRIVRESTPVDFVHWTDFMTFPARARTWKEVTAIGKRVYLSRDQMVKRFGSTIGKLIPLERDDRGQRHTGGAQQAQDQDKGQVYEIWNKEDQTVYWVALGYMYLCDRKDDPLKLEHFFPTPRPLYANPTNNTLVPVPDYIQYQDQAIQIDELTQRIAMLTKACKMTGLYNAAQKDIQRIFNESIENELIPVDDWSAFAEKGGIEGNWSLMPVKDIIGIINELMVCKEKQIEEMNNLTGINDIMRGTSDARETLGGVRLKVNSTGTRLTSRQNEVARFARDTVRIMADIISQHFSPQSIIEASGALQAEGLGPDDMPNLTTLQNPAAPPPAPPQMGAAPGLPKPPMALPPPPAMGGAPGMPPAGGPPMMPPAPPMGAPPQMGGNVVPFRPPGQPGAPGMPPPPPMIGGAPTPPPIPPEMMAKLVSVQRIAKAIGLLRNERLRGFRVDIEVDSTIFPDAAQEKDDRTQFVTAITGFLQQSMTVGASMPEAIPLLAKLMQFGVRGFHVGRELETAIEEFSDQSQEMATKLIQQRNSQPNPEQIKADTEKMKAQVALTTAQMDAQTQQQNNAAEIRRQEVENQGEQTNAALEMRKQQMESQSDQLSASMEMRKQQMENYNDQRLAAIDREKAQLELEMQESDQETTRELEEIKLKIEKLRLKTATKQANKPVSKK